MGQAPRGRQSAACPGRQRGEDMGVHCADGHRMVAYGQPFDKIAPKIGDCRAGG